MKFKNLYGKEKNLKNAKDYLINWNTKTRSKFQDEVKRFLKAYWSEDFVFEEFRIVDTRMTFDFFNANKKIAIEVQGRQHTKFVPFFHSSRAKFLQQLKRDTKKFEFCEINNIKLIEIYDIKELNKEFFESHGVYL
jgi:very-short-patch-repair endonuclease